MSSYFGKCFFLHDIQVGTAQEPVAVITTEGLKSTVLVRKDVFFYSQRDSLPHCGMPEYVRAEYVTREQGLYKGSEVVMNENAHKICYSENDRIVCSVTYSICQCNSDQLLYGADVEGLYCNSQREKEGCITILAESNGHSI